MARLTAKTGNSGEGLREVNRIRAICLYTVSGITLQNMLGIPHAASCATIMLKVGLRLGIIKTS